MEKKGETSELQQLVTNEANCEAEEGIHHDTILRDENLTSPARSHNKFGSSGNTSRSSASNSVTQKTHHGGTSKISFVNEKKVNRDSIKASAIRPRHPHKDNTSSRTVKHHCFISEVPDVRHMETALLGLLNDFNSGKLKAFGSGNTMEQMTKIREQQEKLAKMHFDIAGAADPSSDQDWPRSQSNMGELIRKLEELSESIEALHSDMNR